MQTILFDWDWVKLVHNREPEQLKIQDTTLYLACQVQTLEHTPSINIAADAKVAHIMEMRQQVSLSQMPIICILVRKSGPAHYVHAVPYMCH